MTKLQVVLHLYKAYRSRSDKSFKGNIQDILNTKLKDIHIPGTFKDELLQAGWKLSKVDTNMTLKEVMDNLQRVSKGYKTDLNPLYKWAQFSPVVMDLLKAKKYSDSGRFTEKTEIVSRLLREKPNEFIIDSRQKATVGLTHTPSKFKIHIRKGALPFEFLQKENKRIQKCAGLEKNASRWRALLQAGKLSANAIQRLGIPSAGPVMAKNVANQEMRGILNMPAAKKIIGQLGPVEGRQALQEGIMNGSIEHPLADHMMYMQMGPKPASNAGSWGQIFANRVQSSGVQGPGVSVKPLNLPDPKTLSMDDVHWASPFGGSYHPTTGSIEMPTMKSVPQADGIVGKIKSIFGGNQAIDPRVRARLHELVMATGRHEVGHKQTFENLPLGKRYADLIMRRLGYPSAEATKQDPTKLVTEATGHFRGTLNPHINRSSYSALQMPIDRLREIDPGALEKYRQMIDAQGLGPRLSHRLLSTRAHLHTNYRMY